MPTDRLFRYSISGVVFLFSLVFFYFIFGGDLEALAKWIKDYNFIPFVALFLSTPAIGLILSTFTFGILFWKKRARLHYYVPDDSRILNPIFNEFPEIEISQDRRNTSKDWNDTEMDAFYPYYQTYVRQHITGEAMQYLERRWSVFWTQMNSIFSLFIGAIIIGSERISNAGELCFDPTPIKVVGLLFIGGYCWLAYYLSNVAVEHGKAFEHAALVKAIEDGKKKAIQQNPTSKQSEP